MRPRHFSKNAWTRGAGLRFQPSIALSVCTLKPLSLAAKLTMSLRTVCFCPVTITPLGDFCPGPDTGGKSILVRLPCSCSWSCLAPPWRRGFQWRVPHLAGLGAWSYRICQAALGSSEMGSVPESECHHRYYCFYLICSWEQPLWNWAKIQPNIFKHIYIFIFI